MKKIVKLCLHLSYIAHNSFHFDEIWTKIDLPLQSLYRPDLSRLAEARASLSTSHPDQVVGWEKQTKIHLRNTTEPFNKYLPNWRSGSNVETFALLSQLKNVTKSRRKSSGYYTRNKSDTSNPKTLGLLKTKTTRKVKLTCLQVIQKTKKICFVIPTTIPQELRWVLHIQTKSLVEKNKLKSYRIF